MKSKIISGSVAAAILASLAVPAFAQINVSSGINTSASASVKVTGMQVHADSESSTDADARAGRNRASTTTMQDRMQKGEDRGDQAVNARISALNKLVARINGMKNLTADQKASFTTEIQASVTDMNTLLSKIQSDNSTTSLRADLQAIAPDYRIYMLVMPQLSLLSAVDRVNTLVTSLQTIQTKIQARVSADATLSGNSTITSDLADMTAKLADATKLSAAAQAEITGLKPDQGNATVQASNTAALKDARTKIQTAHNDLVSARKDAGDMVKLITGTHAKANMSATTSTSANVQ